MPNMLKNIKIYFNFTWYIYWWNISFNNSIYYIKFHLFLTLKEKIV